VRKTSETGKLARDLGKLIDSLELRDLDQQFLRARWLDQILWMEVAAVRARTLYQGLRIVTVLGAVVVPALVSLSLKGNAARAVDWLTFAVSLLVAASAAIDGFFHFGTRWRHYRGMAEHLKSEGWSFAELSGPYRRPNATHRNAFPTFVARIERSLGQEVEEYVAQVAPQVAAQPAAAQHEEP
jgi:hypothetical protein